jgi:GNAT superfamily N-acetyltransferase
MRSVTLAGLFAFVIPCLLVPCAPAFAQSKAAEPRPCPEAIASIAGCFAAKHESGAYLLAALPKNWNGHLVVFAHGGPAVVPPTATTSEFDLNKYSIAVKRGFGWVASSYRRAGYGVQMAAEDTEHARRFFVEHVAKPKRTLLHGASYGGMVGAKLIETYAKNADGSMNFDGAFFNSGVVSGAALGHEFRADLRAVYQYYCKNLPQPDEPQYPLWMGLAADSKMTLKDLQALIDDCTGVSKPAAERTAVQKQNLANILGVMRFSDALLVRHMQTATFLFREIAERVTKGRSAFSNAGVQYKGSADDEALNRGVARFTADPEALAALKADGTPTGALPIPVLSIHSINDPQVAVEVQSAYRDNVRAAGSADRLVQAYTDEKAHTAQSAPELAAALDAVLQWVEKGTKPTPQAIAAACEQLRASLDGPCRWHPAFEPKPLATRYARGAATH